MKEGPNWPKAKDPSLNARMKEMGYVRLPPLFVRREEFVVIKEAAEKHISVVQMARREIEHERALKEVAEKGEENGS